MSAFPFESFGFSKLADFVEAASKEEVETVAKILKENIFASTQIEGQYVIHRAVEKIIEWKNKCLSDNKLFRELDKAEIRQIVAEELDKRLTFRISHTISNPTADSQTHCNHEWVRPPGCNFRYCHKCSMYTNANSQ